MIAGHTQVVGPIFRTYRPPATLAINASDAGPWVYHVLPSLASQLIPAALRRDPYQQSERIEDPHIPKPGDAPRPARMGSRRAAAQMARNTWFQTWEGVRGTSPFRHNTWEVCRFHARQVSSVGLPVCLVGSSFVRAPWPILREEALVLLQNRRSPKLLTINDNRLEDDGLISPGRSPRAP